MKSAEAENNSLLLECFTLSKIDELDSGTGGGKNERNDSLKIVEFVNVLSSAGLAERKFLSKLPKKSLIFKFW